MIEVNLYRRHGKNTVTVPEDWNELSKEQLCQVAGILFTNHSSEAERNYKLMRVLCDLPMNKLAKLHPDLVYTELLPLCEWMLKDCTLTSQKIPYIQCGLSRYYGPCDYLSNIVAIEFDFAERALHRWNQERNNIDLLYDFIACIYRPAKFLVWKGFIPTIYNKKINPEGDVRIAFNGNLSSYYTGKLKKHLKPEEAMAIVLWYRGCRKFMAELHPRIFSEKDPKAETEEQDDKQGPAYFNLMRNIANKGTYGIFSDVEQVPIYTLFEDMEAELNAAEAAKQQLEEAKRNREL